MHAFTHTQKSHTRAQPDSVVRNLVGRLTTAVSLLLLTLALASPASAADLGSAKSAGWIGEKPDGYLGLVRSDAPADVKALVSEVNGKRKANYEQIAKQQGAPLTEVEKVGGQTAIEKTTAGNWVMDSSGRWRQK